MLRKRQVEKLVEEHYWEGFFECLGEGLGPQRPLEYGNAPSYYNEVADIAYRSGWRYAERVLEARGKSPFGFFVNRKIPGRVYAEAYGAARLA